MLANSKNRFKGQKVLDKEELYNVVFFKKKGFKKYYEFVQLILNKNLFKPVVLAEEIRVEIGGSCRARRWNQSHLKYGQFGLTLTLLSGAPDLEFLKKTRDDGQFCCVLDWRVFFSVSFSSCMKVEYWVWSFQDWKLWFWSAFLRVTFSWKCFLWKNKEISRNCDEMFQMTLHFLAVRDRNADKYLICCFKTYKHLFEYLVPFTKHILTTNVSEIQDSLCLFCTF